MAKKRVKLEKPEWVQPTAGTTAEAIEMLRVMCKSRFNKKLEDTPFNHIMKYLVPGLEDAYPGRFSMPDVELEVNYFKGVRGRPQLKLFD